MLLLDAKKLEKNISTSIRKDMEDGKIGGASVAVMQCGKTIYQDYFGNEKFGIHVSKDTVFRLASMTKPITTVAILMLIDAGEMHLDDPVSRFIPEFEHMELGAIRDGKLEIIGPAKTAITIRHLLTHTSGVGSGDLMSYLYSVWPSRERTTLKEVVDFHAKSPLDFEPGTKQAYSGYDAFNVLSHIVELVSGANYEQFLKSKIFMPLGMTETTFVPTQDQWNRMIPMFAGVDGNPRIVDRPKNCVFGEIPATCFYGGAGLVSTLEDYKKFADMLLNYGNVEGRRLVSDKMIREMAKPQVSSDIMNGSEVWGLGVRVVVDPSNPYLPSGSYGWSGAYGTHYWVDPTNQITAIYLRNSIDAGGSEAPTARQMEKDVYASLQ